VITEQVEINLESNANGGSSDLHTASFGIQSSHKKEIEYQKAPVPVTMIDLNGEIHKEIEEKSAVVVKDVHSNVQSNISVKQVQIDLVNNEEEL
jgi:hypothetical protein